MANANTTAPNLQTFCTTLSNFNGGDITNLVNAQDNLGDVQFGNVYSGNLTNLPPALRSFVPIPKIAIQVLKVPSNLQSHENHGARWKKLKAQMNYWRAVNNNENITRVLGIAKFTAPEDPDDEDAQSVPSGFEQIAVVTPWMPNGRILGYLEDNPDVAKIPLLVGIAQGLSHLHESSRQIVHGCLTAENILVDENGKPRLTNFGLGPLMEDDKLWRTAAMRAGMGVRYTAPELLRTVKRGYSSNADVYAYGMTSYQILTGRQPFEKYHNDPAVWAAVLFENEIPARPEDINDSLWQELCSCWERDTNKRPSARQLYNAMVKITETPILSGNVLVSGSDDKTVRLWDVENGFASNTIDVPHCVYSLAISSNGTRIATAAAHDDKSEKPLTMMNVEDQNPIWTAVGCGVVVFSPDGRFLASSSRDNNVVLWRASEGTKHKVLAKHDKRVTSIAFSPRGDKIVTGSFDKSVKIWNVASGQEERLLTTGTSYVNCVAWSSDGQVIAAMFRTNLLRLWNLTTDRASRIQMPTMMQCIAFSPTKPLIATGSKEGPLHFWDINTGQESGVPSHNHTESITSVAFNGDGSMLATASDDMSVRVWNTEDREEIHAFADHDNKVKCVAFVPTPS